MPLFLERGDRGDRAEFAEKGRTAPNTTVNFTNPASFGKVSTSTSDEGTTANAGGQPLMNITLTFRF